MRQFRRANDLEVNLSNKWQVSGVNYANLDQPIWNLVITVRGPLGATSTFYPATPPNYESLTLTQVKEYALQEWAKANAG